MMNDKKPLGETIYYLIFEMYVKYERLGTDTYSSFVNISVREPVELCKVTKHYLKKYRHKFILPDYSMYSMIFP